MEKPQFSSEGNLMPIPCSPLVFPYLIALVLNVMENTWGFFSEKHIKEPSINKNIN